jgi:hypothetical protein
MVAPRNSGDFWTVDRGELRHASDQVRAWSGSRLIAGVTTETGGDALLTTAVRAMPVSDHRLNGERPDFEWPTGATPSDLPAEQRP